MVRQNLSVVGSTVRLLGCGWRFGGGSPANGYGAGWAVGVKGACAIDLLFLYEATPPFF